jgi:DnaD/phage-associated family protein
VSDERFGGFPAIGKATVIPNAFFGLILPLMKSPSALLAFMWVSKVAQEAKGDARFASADQLCAHHGVLPSFEHIGGGREGLITGLDECVDLGALLSVTVAGHGEEEALYFVNNPASRRAIARARAGELKLVPEKVVVPTARTEARPSIFRLYEEHIGTITPMVGDRLIEAEELYPPSWIEDAFREAAELNARNWRYIERILAHWAEEGRANETAGRDPLEEQKQRFLGGNLGHIVRYR